MPNEVPKIIEQNFSDPAAEAPERVPVHNFAPNSKNS
jgi:hypothetical protein